MISIESKNLIEVAIKRNQKEYFRRKLYWKIFDNTVHFLENERFVWIKGYKELYLISNYGRVYSKRSEKLLKPGLDRDNYLLVNLSVNNKPKMQKVHRLVLINFGREPKLYEICRHLDGNPQNNYIDNLEWGTSKDNSRDSRLHGTLHFNEEHPQCKLDNNEVIEIREKYKSGKYTQKQLAKEYNCSREHIGGIVRNDYRKL